ncbi:recombination regulator RecX [Pseudomonas typographi]|uniref:Regulatory protein RecX n=1 Tax=Pseudomonas typographi TaxID=2715964 RepID=A0ABR7YXU9_9PSED|nr:recombination regulator RecX [Pseudomonas typographi]MBD1598022.1 recombination regulator RecX [Pseudomonas typographi]
MATLDTPVAVRRAAMDLLARREHGRVELERKLRKRGASDVLIEAALDGLAQDGLLSEARYLEAFINTRARAGYGPARIREALSQRGLPRGDVEQALRESAFDWATQLHATWARKFGGLRPADAKERAKQLRFLVYRGYSPELASRLLNGRLFDD